jgi:hypothetical protein
MLRLLDGVTLTLQQNLTPAATTIKVSAADALKLNKMTVGDIAYLTFMDGRGIETVKYTHSGVITAAPGTVNVPVDRAQLGTTAKAWPKNACLRVHLTEPVLTQFIAEAMVRLATEQGAC